jgi:hypothetical protein
MNIDWKKWWREKQAKTQNDQVFAEGNERTNHES